ncbi:GFA family protein [Mangrovicella endophytica]|uniref:GFA family protein n=1 Tax=Mangrovicella endophytica TaxID=2066697 RepID=UPI0012FFE4F0|nr:GFA family protein [Mangrovicella endophytica]
MSELTGGCQCGAIRYTVKGEPAMASLCECRMCQRSAGAPLLGHAQFSAQNVVWHKQPPKLFRSSSVADRGFCPDCGTPLTYQYLPTGTISITLSSLDDPEAIIPTSHLGAESRPSWLVAAMALPNEPAELDGGGVQSFQFAVPKRS